MGKVEAKVRRARRLGIFQVALLGAVAIGAVVLIAAAAPNTAQLLRYFPGYKKGARFQYQSKSALSRLAALGLVTFVEENGKRYARITAKGRQRLAIETAELSLKKKRRWDRRWRIIIFDIPERRRKTRVRLRQFMSRCGLVRLQDSVWAYPYDCEDLIALVKTEFRLGLDVLYMVVEQLEYDKHLREHFGLPSH